jgi:pantoate kinase
LVLRGKAFAPAAISNFFAIHYSGEADPARLGRFGATGGGYALASGVTTAALVTRDAGTRSMTVTVNGNPEYEAETTRTAVGLLLDSLGERHCRVELDQTMGVPVGCGFGASAASSLSAVMAVASAISSKLDRESVAYFAHAADILCKTGLGTVSVIYRYGGAGVIVEPGAPGVSKVLAVKVPRDVRVVTASLGPYEKGPLLTSPGMATRINRLGAESIRVASDLSLESLLRAGEAFTEGLGIWTPRVRRLARAAKAAGAMGASQNMVGQAVHAVTAKEDASQVAAALKATDADADVAVHLLADGPARTIA